MSILESLWKDAGPLKRMSLFRHSPVAAALDPRILAGEHSSILNLEKVHTEFSHFSIPQDGPLLGSAADYKQRRPLSPPAKLVFTEPPPKDLIILHTITPSSSRRHWR